MPPAMQQRKQAPVAPPQIFRVGTYAAETNDYDESKTMLTSDVNFPNYTLTPNGWLRGLWFLFECTTSGNSANVAFTADGPFSAIKKVTFKDVGNREVFGPLTGYDWMTVMKFGGYHEIGDPRSDPNYAATTGTGGTGGSFTIIMYLPLEIVHRDALGDIENKSSTSSYKVETVLAQSTDIYSTSPTTLGSVRLRVVEDGFTEPQAVDEMGRPLAQAPPAAGTMQYWANENDALATGLGKYLIQNGLGYSIRNIIFKLVDSNGSRAQGDSDWPDPVTFSFGKIQLFQRYKKIWISKMAKDYGLTSASTDASLGRENGVFPVWFTKDFGLKPGAELRNTYLTTKPGNVLQWQGTIGGSGTHTLYTTVNYVVPPGEDPARLRASR
jgi:hypothetical protein